MISSLQRNLETLLEAIDPEEAVVTASALSQARARLRHTAFIELNEYCLREFYQKPRGAALARAGGHRGGWLHRVTVVLPR